jgi:lysozyme family protein
MTIQAMIEATIGKEGGYSNNAADAGGETMWGITIGVARQQGYDGPMRSMPRDVAIEIYRRMYFTKPGFAKVADLSEKVAEELFDTAVNMGPARPSLWFQQVLNALNRQGKDYGDIAEDGQIGGQTMKSLERLIAVRGKEATERVVLIALNSLQGAEYIRLSAVRGANETFVFGWLANRVGLA